MVVWIVYFGKLLFTRNFCGVNNGVGNPSRCLTKLHIHCKILLEDDDGHRDNNDSNNNNTSAAVKGTLESFLRAYQFDFRSECSMTMAVTEIIRKIVERFGKYEHVALTLCDLSLNVSLWILFYLKWTNTVMKAYYRIFSHPIYIVGNSAFHVMVPSLIWRVCILSFLKAPFKALVCSW